MLVGEKVLGIIFIIIDRSEINKTFIESTIPKLIQWLDGVIPSNAKVKLNGQDLACF
jgi:hypothetical protein